ncbi:MAG: NAD-dependent epimerase/dehydratase family protein [Proteobacteria bacterium]|nr:NAD-dependent epimerase/dehydratase family protein [Pseudomonadota bacterium]
MRVLVTGATGFVGEALCTALCGAGHTVRAALRRESPLSHSVAERVVVGEIGAATDWKAALRGVDAIMHAAARAHVVRDDPGNARLYTEVNVNGTRHLVKTAAQAAICRFVYVSSIKVNGEETPARSFTPDDAPNPRDIYGISKMLAEEAILETGQRTGMQTAIVRPPLVYGPGVRANFLRLMRWVDKEWPLPLASVRNRRSLVSIWNLCDLLVRLLNDPLPTAGTWLVSDGQDLSTPDLLRRIGTAMDRRVRLLPVPPVALRSAAALLMRKAEAARLCGSLTLDISQTCRALGWSPPMGVDEGLKRTVDWYLSRDRSHES